MSPATASSRDRGCGCKLARFGREPLAVTGKRIDTDADLDCHKGEVIGMREPNDITP